MKKQKIILRIAFLIAILLTVYACIEPEILKENDLNESLAGGAQTVFETGSNAFGSTFPNLIASRVEVHEIGDEAFNATFVSAPSIIHPGLGMVFNNVSCSACHIADGRGKPPANNEQLASLLIRLSIPGTDLHGGPNPVPGFGGQLQPRAVFGVKPEASIKIMYNEQVFTFTDGDTYSLQTPTYTLENPYTELPADVMTSPRIAPPVFGLGLLEAIPESDIVANADENDANQDGISGKPNYAWNIIKKKKTLGRFGWKAANPSVLQQTAGAYSEDMGITNFIFQEESCYGQPQYSDTHYTYTYEVSDSLLQAVAFYIRTLAVPARRNVSDPMVLQGKKIFNDAKCSACHKPTWRTEVNVAFHEISNQVIFPYTDMLIHDMGSGLADNRPDFEANGQEWRTSPLWGIGLTKVVNGHNNFLHDGRARTLLEAVMWHGGEAEQSKNYIKSVSKSERNALVKFLESL